jgi:hypothetical protein
MSPSVRELLLHILDETSYLLSACDQLSQADFLSDPSLCWDRLRNGLGCGDVQGGRA